MVTKTKSSIAKNTTKPDIGKIFDGHHHKFLSIDDFIVELSSSNNQLTIQIKEIEKEKKVAGHQYDELIHPDEVKRVLERAATDCTFATDLLHYRADSLSDYELTDAERLAILTGDINWVKSRIGPLSELQKSWFDQRLSAEIW